MVTPFSALRRPRPLSLPAVRKPFFALDLYTSGLSPSATAPPLWPASSVRWASIAPFTIHDTLPPSPPLTLEQAQAQVLFKDHTQAQTQPKAQTRTQAQTQVNGQGHTHSPHQSSEQQTEQTTQLKQPHNLRAPQEDPPAQMEVAQRHRMQQELHRVLAQDRERRSKASVSFSPLPQGKESPKEEMTSQPKHTTKLSSHHSTTDKKANCSQKSPAGQIDKLLEAVADQTCLPSESLIASPVKITTPRAIACIPASTKAGDTKCGRPQSMFAPKNEAAHIRANEDTVLTKRNYGGSSATVALSPRRNH